MTRRANFQNIRNAFRHRNYALFLGGMTPAMVTLWMHRIAVGWLAWQLTNSLTWLGIIAFADSFPVILLSPLAGAIADRVFPLRILYLTQIVKLCQALALFAFAITGAMTIWILLGLTLIVGINQAFDAAPRHTMIPNLVPREDLPAAIAIDSAMFNASRFIGPALAGVVIVGTSVAWVFAINAAGFACYLGALTCLKLTPPVREGVKKRAFGRDIIAGWRYVAGHAGIGPALLLLTIISVIGRPVMDLLPGVSAEIFHRGAGGLAWLAGSMGLGAMIGTVWLATRGETAGLTNIIVTNTLLLSLAIMAFTATEIFPLGLFFMVTTGFSISVCGIGIQTLIQSSVDGAMRGRVMSLFVMVYRGVPAFGAVILGTIAENVGLQFAFAGGAVVCLAAWGLASQRRQRMIPALEAEKAG